MKNLLVVLMVLLLIGLACEVPEENSSEQSEKVTVVDAAELAKAYEENEVSADEKYKGKRLEITGKIMNIAVTWGELTVTIIGKGATVPILCSFKTEKKGSIAKLKKGEKVTLIGSGNGFTAGLYAEINNCEVKQKDPGK